MANDEPDYESFTSRHGQSSEDGQREERTEEPHPFWSERAQDEFWLQQLRPRELDLMGLDESNREVLLGIEGSPAQEPPYGEGIMGHEQVLREGLLREAVQEVLAENESLRKRVTDLEAFSSVRSSSSRDRPLASSAGRSADFRPLEPDYDSLLTSAAAQETEGRVTPRVNEVIPEDSTPAVGMRAIMQRSV